MLLKPIIALAQLGVAACTLTGCVTAALWEDGRFLRMHEPAAPPNLRLFLSPNEEKVLVQYDETVEGKDSIKLRTYWISLNSQPPDNPHRPPFVSAKTVQGLTAIPIVPPESDLAKTNTPPFAISETYPVGFTLNRANRAPIRYDLPVFDDGSGLTKQILITPFAVTADAVIVGGILSLIYVGYGAPYWFDQSNP